eukprot:6976589-Alexandrium_andersonii.AAC.1
MVASSQSEEVGEDQRGSPLPSTGHREPVRHAGRGRLPGGQRGGHRQALHRGAWPRAAAGPQ